MIETPKKQKILFLITKGNFGGAQRYVYDLARSLPKDSFEIVVALGETGMLAAKLEEEKIRTIEIPSLQRDINPILELGALKEIITVLKKERPDILHVNSSKAGGIGALAGRILNVKKIIFTAHNFAWNEKRNIFWKAFTTIGHFFTALFAHHVICVSEKNAAEARRMPFVENKIVVIKNGIDSFELLSVSDARKKIIPRMDEHAFIIGTIAELHVNKGIDVLLSAFDQIENKNTHLIIIGDGERRNDLEQQTENLKHKDRISFLGKVENARMYLKAFDMFVLPSRNEALPYVLLEAGSASLPVIATNVGGIPEIIDNDQNGILVQKEDTESLAHAIELMQKNDEKRLAFGASLHQKIVTDFTLSNMVQKTIDLYNIST